MSECIRFGSEVTEARFDETASHWVLTVRSHAGRARGAGHLRRRRVRRGAAQPAVVPVHRGP